MYIGCHLSIAKGYGDAAKAALNIGANVFQFFLVEILGGFLF